MRLLDVGADRMVSGAMKGKGKHAGLAFGVMVIVAVLVRMLLWPQISDKLGFGNRVECATEGAVPRCVVYTRSGLGSPSRWRACWETRMTCTNGRTLQHKRCQLLKPGTRFELSYPASSLAKTDCKTIRSINATKVRFKSVGL